MPFSTIPAEVGAIQRLGRYNRTLAPGPHLVVPLVARIGTCVGVVDMDGATLMVEAVD